MTKSEVSRRKTEPYHIRMPMQTLSIAPLGLERQRKDIASSLLRRRAATANDKHSRIVRRNLDIQPAGQAAHTRTRPSFRDLVCSTRSQAWDLAPSRSHLGRRVVKIQDEDERALLELSGPVLSGERCIECPVWIGSPLIRSSRGAVLIILVECQEILVLQDGDVVRRDRTKICADEQRRFHGCPERKVRARFCGSEISVTDFEHVGI